jgi:branched-chain amino acid transport system substrate-binding protein
MIAKAAIERAGGVDKAKVRDEIEKTQGFIGTAGVFNLRGCEKTPPACSPV